MNQNEKWYYAKNKVTKGPITLGELRSLIQRGDLKANEPVYHESLGQWTPVAKVSILQDVFTVAPPIGGKNPSSGIGASTGRSSGAAISQSTSSTASPVGGNYGVQPPPSTGGYGNNISPMVQTPVRQPGPAQVTAPVVNNLGNNGNNGNFGGNTPGSVADNSSDREGSSNRNVLFDVSDNEESNNEGLGGMEAQVRMSKPLEEGWHPLDIIPYLLRSRFNDQFALLSGRLFTTIGVWVQIIAIAVLIIQIGIDFKFSELAKLFPESGFLFQCALFYGVLILFLIASNYVNVRLGPSIERLNRIGEGRMISFAVSDSIALVLLMIGIVFLVHSLGASLQTQHWQSIPAGVIFGFFMFVFFAYGAVTAANPESMQMGMDKTLAPNEEAVGVIQYLAKLALRLACGWFGIGVTFCTCMIGYHQVMAITKQSSTTMSMFPPSFYAVLLVLFSFLPFVAYILFQGIQFFLDYSQKIIQKSRRRG